MKNIYKILCLGAFMVPGMLFAQKPEVTVMKAKSAITLDGAGTEAAWADAPLIAVGKTFAGETVTGGDASFKLLYDAENIYIYVDVTDDVVTVDGSADWKGDKVEIYFGLPGYEPGKGAAEDHARQFYCNGSADYAGLGHPDFAYTATWPDVKDAAKDGVDYAIVETLGGYSFEMKINKSALENVDFATIDSLGFDVCLADNDVVGDGAGVRNRKVLYNTGDLQFANENWGAMDVATLKFDGQPWQPTGDKPVVTVEMAKSAITLDGSSTEAAWTDAPVIAVGKTFAGETVTGGDATFQLLYDTDNVYIYVDVTDDLVTVDGSADWKGDKVEIYFGLPGYEPGKGAAEDHARQFYCNGSADYTGLGHPDFAYTATWPDVKDAANDGVDYAIVETLGGYSFEMKINKSALENVDFSTIDSLGFDVCLADNDVVGDGAGVRNRKVFYNSGDLQFANENWGAMDVATLVFAIPNAIQIGKTTNHSAYIAYDMLKFKGYDKAVNVEIYSMLGQKVLTAKNINEVSVAGLTKGLYIVRINGGKDVFKVMK